VIDEVWHLHILNTENYADMCKALEISFLHHKPTVSVKDLQKCREQFQMTLKMYKEAFGRAPPSEIWEKSSNGYCSG
jgi:hypothetical protein